MTTVKQADRLVTANKEPRRMLKALGLMTMEGSGSVSSRHQPPKRTRLVTSR